MAGASSYTAGMQRFVFFVAVVIGLAIAPFGCVKRTIMITSEPAGALVYLNDREIGRTPVETEFLYYGRYDVRLVREGSEPLLTYGDATAPVWEWVPLDFLAEMAPWTAHSRVTWHYPLSEPDDSPERLLERAAAMRGESAAATAPAATQVSPGS